MIRSYTKDDPSGLVTCDRSGARPDPFGGAHRDQHRKNQWCIEPTPTQLTIPITDQVCASCDGSGEDDEAERESFMAPGCGCPDHYASCPVHGPTAPVYPAVFPCPTCQGRGTLPADIIVVRGSGLPVGEYEAERFEEKNWDDGSIEVYFGLTPRGESQ